MASLILTAFAAVPLPFALGPAWAEFTREPALAAPDTRVEIGTLGFDRDRGQLRFWLRRTTSDGETVEISWTDSRTCPAVEPMLAAMRDLPVARFAPLGVPGVPPGSIVLDGVKYSLKTRSDHDGKVTVETNVETPLAAWVETSLAALQTCWTSTEPQREQS